MSASHRKAAAQVLTIKNRNSLCSRGKLKMKVEQILDIEISLMKKTEIAYKNARKQFRRGHYFLTIGNYGIFSSLLYKEYKTEGINKKLEIISDTYNLLISIEKRLFFFFIFGLILLNSLYFHSMYFYLKVVSFVKMAIYSLPCILLSIIIISDFIVINKRYKDIIFFTEYLKLCITLKEHEVITGETGNDKND
jgi:hypothetical protein